MEIRDLNLLPVMVTSGEITAEEGTKLFASFVCKNYPIYGLHKYDEDIRSEVFVKLLEKGEKVFELFNPKTGDFFTFSFCFVKSQLKATVKSAAKKNLSEKVLLENSVNNLSDDNPLSNLFEPVETIDNLVPYAPKKITLEELKNALQNQKLERYDRSILVLAAKSSYYIKDSTIQKISKIYNMDVELLYDIIQYFKENVDNHKKEHLEHDLELINAAYYRHKKYQEMIQNLNERNTKNYEFEKQKLLKKDEYQKHNLNSLNKKFKEGYLYLRPKTSSVSEVFDICDRQVNYYLHCLKKGKIDKSLLKKIQKLQENEQEL